ncbi:hypothetical protein ACFL0R_01080 [Pseudomonadota bacterium]
MNYYNKTSFSEWHAIRTEKLSVFYKELKPVVEPLIVGGYSLGRLAEYLNQKGHLTFYGKKWTPVLVSRTLKKMGLRTIFQTMDVQKEGGND